MVWMKNRFAEAVIEEAVPLAVKADEFAAVAGGLHLRGKRLRCGERDDSVGPAMEDDHWRFARADVVSGGKLPRFGPQLLGQ